MADNVLMNSGSSFTVGTLKRAAQARVIFVFTIATYAYYITQNVSLNRFLYSNTPMYQPHTPVVEWFVRPGQHEPKVADYFVSAQSSSFVRR
jgi:hypothetical protein